MTLIHFHTPFILGANLTPDGTFHNEGFFVCNDGAIVLDTVKKIIILLENEDCDQMANVRLVISLTNVHHIKAKRFCSTGQNYCGS